MAKSAYIVFFAFITSYVVSIIGCSPDKEDSDRLLEDVVVEDVVPTLSIGEPLYDYEKRELSFKVNADPVPKDVLRVQFQVVLGVFDRDVSRSNWEFSLDKDQPSFTVEMSPPSINPYTHSLLKLKLIEGRGYKLGEPSEIVLYENPNKTVPQIVSVTPSIRLVGAPEKAVIWDENFYPFHPPNMPSLRFEFSPRVPEDLAVNHGNISISGRWATITGPFPPPGERLILSWAKGLASCETDIVLDDGGILPPSISFYYNRFEMIGAGGTNWQPLRPGAALGTAAGGRLEIKIVVNQPTIGYVGYSGRITRSFDEGTLFTPKAPHVLSGETAFIQEWWVDRRAWWVRVRWELKGEFTNSYGKKTEVDFTFTTGTPLAADPDLLKKIYGRR